MFLISQSISLDTSLYLLLSLSVFHFLSLSLHSSFLASPGQPSVFSPLSISMHQQPLTSPMRSRSAGNEVDQPIYLSNVPSCRQEPTLRFIHWLSNLLNTPHLHIIAKTNTHTQVILGEPFSVDAGGGENGRIGGKKGRSGTGMGEESIGMKAQSLIQC